jgi:ferredoxin
MRVEVDLTRCQGYGNCLAAAPEVFDLNDDGLVMILRQPEGSDEAASRSAAKLCPVKAITVVDDD